jgi:hypothetical protein
MLYRYRQGSLWAEIMKQKQNKTGTGPASTGDQVWTSTIFEQVTDVQIELTKSLGLPLDHLPQRSSHDLPKWSSKILEKFRQTIFKPILKLKPKGTVSWRSYGRIFGIIERFKTFITSDLERIAKEEGWDKISDEQRERIRPLFGEDKMRQHLIKAVGRPVAEDEPLENLVVGYLERQFEHFEKLKNDALWFVAQSDAKTTALFFKGMSEGYNCFLDENGGFAGDRGRTSLYFQFLTYRLEIERYRRTMPIKSRRDFQIWVFEKAKIPIPKDGEWFDHFCDEICLSVKGVGRKPSPQVL